jgi:glucosamine--fructose-6-phosphate aminotransferase (isomerizing)
MCGIVGYIGKREAFPVLIDGLKRLEYRGYDSAGLAYHTDEGIKTLKVIGRITELEKEVAKQHFRPNVGIAHTRWATHGEPSITNAHPHTDCTGKIAVVHNGIIENYRALRKYLTDRGHIFRTETDTEFVQSGRKLLR